MSGAFEHQRTADQLNSPATGHSRDTGDNRAYCRRAIGLRAPSAISGHRYRAASMTARKPARKSKAFGTTARDFLTRPCARKVSMLGWRRLRFGR